jgi:hypothetical protein
MWYATYQSRQPEVDINGDLTGGSVVQYSEPVEFHANLSATRGAQGFTGTGASYDYFGQDIKYDLIISTAQMDLPIDEHTLVWTHEPDIVNGQVDYKRADFKVKAVAHGLYHMKYAIRSLQKGET